MATWAAGMGLAEIRARIKSVNPGMSTAQLNAAARAKYQRVAPSKQPAGTLIQNKQGTRAPVPPPPATSMQLTTDPNQTALYDPEEAGRLQAQQGKPITYYKGGRF